MRDVEVAEPVGIWRSAGSYFEPYVDPEFRLSLGEGNTPLVSMPALAEHIGVAALMLKRDDLSPGGSHKCRSLAYRISLGRQQGNQAFVISSSGNAAVAASLYTAAAGLRLIAFVSPQTSAVKLGALERPNVIVVQSEKPRNLARYAARVFEVPNLTPSLDDLSIEGFKSIAVELLEQSDFDDVFTFVTSASSFMGIGQVLRQHDQSQRFNRQHAVHAVQAGDAAAVAGPSDSRFASRQAAGNLQPSHLAGLLGIDETPRAEAARQLMSASGGRGWVQDDTEIAAAAALLRQSGIDTSAEGAACLSAAMRARQEGALSTKSRVVVMLTGHGSQWTAPPPSTGMTLRLDGYNELRQALSPVLGSPRKPA